MIKIIKVTNVKGIGQDTNNSTFEFDLHPNRPNIFVAPNGFGKSSLATAFISLQSNRIMLHRDHYYEDDENNKPEISITYLKSDGAPSTLNANESLNQLHGKFGWFVINNQLFAKAKKNNIGGQVIASASLETPPIILTNSIPPNVTVNYSISEQKEWFGQNGKILKNLNDLYKSNFFAFKIESWFDKLTRANGLRIQTKINTFRQRTNEAIGNVEEIKTWIINEQLGYLQQIPFLEELAELLMNMDLGYESVADSYLTAIQIIRTFNSNPNLFKNLVKRRKYDFEKEGYTSLFKGFNSSWKEFKPTEIDGKLVIKIPKTIHISNGQRDVMCFISLLKKAELQLTGESCILIIDEVFDYLDNANLISVQYYITQLIKKFHDQQRKIYPIILTHLNPYYFKNFTFSKQKVFFVDKRNPKINQHLKKILVNRENETIRDCVSKYHLHFHPLPKNIRVAFEALGLKPTWGESQVFTQYVNEEFQKYIDEENVYDPFAVCCALRKKIELHAYNQIQDGVTRIEFLNTHKTTDKLRYAEERGAIIPEIYYLLGLIYNDGLHWKDNESSISGNLEHLTIRNMISEINV